MCYNNKNEENIRGRKMKKFVLSFLILWLFAGLCIAKDSTQNNLTKYPKSGSYKIKTRSNTILYGKDGHKKSSTLNTASGNTVTTKYDKTGKKTKTVIKNPNGTTKVYNKNGKLTKKKQTTTYPTKHGRKRKQTKTVVKNSNETTKVYNKNGELIKKKQVTTYSN